MSPALHPSSGPARGTDGDPGLVAWNGVRFVAPAGFEPVRIDRTGLGLAERIGGVRVPGPGQRPGGLEIFWGNDRVGFRPEARLARLGRSLARDRSGPGVRPMDLPAAWRPVLGSFEARAFAVPPGPAGRGEETGALLFCPACGTVTVVRFQGRTARDEAAQALVLGSYADHAQGRPDRPDGEGTRYRLFDLDLHLPAMFRLDAQAFSPGHFRLCFSADGRTRLAGRLRLDIHRLGPADALLAGRSLADCAARLASGLDGEGPCGWTVRDPAPGPAIELWRPGSGRPGPLVRLAARLAPGLAGRTVVRLWPVAGRNRLLAVVAGSPSAVDPGLFESVCQGVSLA